MKNKIENILFNVNEEISLIHPVMRPEEIREGDPISCFLIENEIETAIVLWSFCPFGFEFISDQSFHQKIGMQFKFKVSFSKETIFLNGVVVFESATNEKYKIGVRINYQIDMDKNSEIERRTRSRWKCPEHLLSTGSAPNPIKYNDFIFFKVVDVSSNGLKLATSLRNKILIVGQKLECTFSVPMIGNICGTVRINRVAVEQMGNKEQLILGVSFLKFDQIISSTFSEYLLTFAENCTVKSLENAGFDCNINSKNFDFSYAKTKHEYEEVLSLRYESYKQSGKMSDKIDKNFMIDEFDSRSRILTVKLQGKLIASARAMFHEKNDKTSHERYLEYPDNFPDVTECLEVSRVCVKPDFQGVGIAREVAKHLALLAIKSGRKYIYLSATDKLVQFWLDLGFKETGVTYVHEQLGNLEHKLLICNVEEAILSKNISGKNWLHSFDHLYDYCTEYGFIQPSLLDVSRVFLRRTFKKMIL